MANTIEAAERVEAAVTSLKNLLAAQEKLAKTLDTDALDNTINGTKQLIKTNAATAKLIRDTAIDG